jgi:hypothetical protein
MIAYITYKLNVFIQLLSRDAYGHDKRYQPKWFTRQKVPPGFELRIWRVLITVMRNTSVGCEILDFELKGEIIS